MKITIAVLALGFLADATAVPATGMLPLPSDAIAKASALEAKLTPAPGAIEKGPVAQVGMHFFG